jgi:TolB-like protein/class 3 adenylate cyclase
MSFAIGFMALLLSDYMYPVFKKPLSPLAVLQSAISRDLAGCLLGIHCTASRRGGSCLRAWRDDQADGFFEPDRERKLERRLAAIMFADVVGYSRHSQADEEGTRAKFHEDLNSIFAPFIAAHNGRLVKTIGDAILAEFQSVVGAARCAIDIQRAKAGCADNPDRNRLIYRIGINLGDVIVEGEDLHGDGVNIGERLQALAEPGGIVLSGAAYDQLETRLAAEYEFLGHKKLKNLIRPLRVYQLLLQPSHNRARSRWLGWSWPKLFAALLVVVLGAGGLAWWHPWVSRFEPASKARMSLALPDKPSIAVLPFANMSSSPDQEYLSDGISDDLITALSRVSGLFVIARNSTFIFKGRNVPPKQVSEELGVHYVLEGSVQKSGDRLRINAQLIDAFKGVNAWADHFDGSIGDVFTLQDQVTRGVTDALAITLTDAEQQSIGRQETDVPEAYEEFLRGWVHIRHETPEDYQQSIWKRRSG